MPLFQPIVATRTASEVVKQVEMLVLDGILRPGDRLPGERDLAEQFAVSRPVVREAIGVLEERGVLESRHGEGTYVADLIGEVFTAPMLRLIASHPEALLDYLDYRMDIEAVAAEHAARRATDDDKARLAELMAEMEAAHREGDPKREGVLDVRFHTIVAESAHNLVLLHTLRSCYRLLRDGVFFSRDLIYTLPNARDALFQQHRAIADAVMAGDAVAAGAASRAHIGFIADAMQEARRTGDFSRVAKLRRLAGEA